LEDAVDKANIGKRGGDAEKKNVVQLLGKRERKWIGKKKGRGEGERGNWGPNGELWGGGGGGKKSTRNVLKRWV